MFCPEQDGIYRGKIVVRGGRECSSADAPADGRGRAEDTETDRVTMIKK